MNLQEDIVNFNIHNVKMIVIIIKCIIFIYIYITVREKKHHCNFYSSTLRTPRTPTIIDLFHISFTNLNLNVFLFFSTLASR